MLSVEERGDQKTKNTMDNVEETVDAQLQSIVGKHLTELSNEPELADPSSIVLSEEEEKLLAMDEKSNSLEELASRIVIEGCEDAQLENESEDRETLETESNENDMPDANVEEKEQLQPEVNEPKEQTEVSGAQEDENVQEEDSSEKHDEEKHENEEIVEKNNIKNVEFQETESVTHLENESEMKEVENEMERVEHGNQMKEDDVIEHSEGESSLSTIDSTVLDERKEVEQENLKNGEQEIEKQEGVRDSECQDKQEDKQCTEETSETLHSLKESIEMVEDQPEEFSQAAEKEKEEPASEETTKETSDEQAKDTGVANPLVIETVLDEKEENDQGEQEDIKELTHENPELNDETDEIENSKIEEARVELQEVAEKVSEVKEENVTETNDSETLENEKDATGVTENDDDDDDDANVDAPKNIEVEDQDAESDEAAEAAMENDKFSVEDVIENNDENDTKIEVSENVETRDEDAEFDKTVEKDNGTKGNINVKVDDPEPVEEAVDEAESVANVTEIVNGADDANGGTPETVEGTECRNVGSEETEKDIEIDEESVTKVGDLENDKDQETVAEIVGHENQEGESTDSVTEIKEEKEMKVENVEVEALNPDSENEAEKLIQAENMDQEASQEVNVQEPTSKDATVVDSRENQTADNDTSIGDSTKAVDVEGDIENIDEIQEHKLEDTVLTEKSEIIGDCDKPANEGNEMGDVSVEKSTEGEEEEIEGTADLQEVSLEGKKGKKGKKNKKDCSIQ